MKEFMSHEPFEPTESDMEQVAALMQRALPDLLHTDDDGTRSIKWEMLDAGAHNQVGIQLESNEYGDGRLFAVWIQNNMATNAVVLKQYGLDLNTREFIVDHEYYRSPAEFQELVYNAPPREDNDGRLEELLTDLGLYESSREEWQEFLSLLEEGGRQADLKIAQSLGMTTVRKIKIEKKE